MSVWLRHAALAGGLVLFAILHSLLAAPGVRVRLERVVGARFYRLAYNLFAIVSIVLVFVATRGGSPTIWDATGALAVSLRMVQVAAILFFVMAFRPLDLGHLTGLQQLRGRFAERCGLRTGGVYAFCRHPLYLGTCVFATSTPHMDARGLIVALWLWAYAYTGARIEERKLHVQFGDAYRRYCATTPRLMPRLRRAPRLVPRERHVSRPVAPRKAETR